MIFGLFSLLGGTLMDSITFLYKYNAKILILYFEHQDIVTGADYICYISIYNIHKTNV